MNLWHSFSVLTGIALFIGMLILFYLGRWAGLRRRGSDERARSGLGMLDNATLALLGLLIAFSFAGAAARFDARREMIVQEANCIGTAWLRIDLLAPAVQPAMRAHFREYVDARIAVYDALPDMPAAMARLSHANELQGRIWKEAVDDCAAGPSTQAATILLLPALNQMFDIMTSRTAMTEIHSPSILFILLIVVAAGSAAMVGHASAGPVPPNWMHVAGFAAAVSITIAVIIDLEYPRKGLIQESHLDRVMVELRGRLN